MSDPRGRPVGSIIERGIGGVMRFCLIEVLTHNFVVIS